MARFDRQIATALRLIKKNGAPVKWVQLTDGAPADPLKPWLPSASVKVENDVYICFLPDDRDSREFLSYLKGTEVPTGCVMGLMGNVPFDPAEKDVVLREGKELRINSIDLLAPNNQKILYTVEFKK